MKPSSRALLLSMLFATIFVGGCAFGIHKLFSMNLSSWSSPWLWGPAVFLWLSCAGSFLTQNALPLEVLWYLDRDIAKK